MESTTDPHRHLASPIRLDKHRQLFSSSTKSVTATATGYSRSGRALPHQIRHSPYPRPSPLSLYDSNAPNTTTTTTLKPTLAPIPTTPARRPANQPVHLPLSPLNVLFDNARRGMHAELAFLQNSCTNIINRERKEKELLRSGYFRMKRELDEANERLQVYEYHSSCSSASSVKTEEMPISLCPYPVQSESREHGDTHSRTTSTSASSSSSSSASSRTHSPTISGDGDEPPLPPASAPATVGSNPYAKPTVVVSKPRSAPPSPSRMSFMTRRPSFQQRHSHSSSLPPLKRRRVADLDPA